MKKLERLIPMIVMLLIALFFFRLGVDYQKDKYIPCEKVYIDSELLGDYLQHLTYGDTMRYFNKDHIVVGEFLINQ